MKKRKRMNPKELELLLKEMELAKQSDNLEVLNVQKSEVTMFDDLHMGGSSNRSVVH